jgi:hypothetical protein
MRRKHKQRQVAIIAPFFEYYPIVAPSMVCQRHQNWKLFLIHDGPCPQVYKDMLESLVKADDRINFLEIEKCKGVWGHEIRERMIERIGKGEVAPDADYIMITNGDNYHCPCQLDQLISGFQHDRIVAVAHDGLAHNYQNWSLLPLHASGQRIVLGHIDIAQILIRKDVAYEIGWHDMSHSSDWTLINAILTKYGQQNFPIIPGMYAVHN